MRRLSQIILIMLLAYGLQAQSPHGEELTIACEDCHTSESWKVQPETFTFRHNDTRFKLTGMHEDVDCKSCHPTLVFSQADNACVSCHTDMHNQTVGMDCDRCHSTSSWLVENISEIHRQSRFPLLGPHATADCFQCHPSASLLRFEPRGVDCYECHRQDYETAIPDHSNFSENCIECHSIYSNSWSDRDFNHSFFPLKQGHEIDDCAACHPNNMFQNTSTYCYDCHQQDYVAAVNPTHQGAGFSTECAECHTTAVGWAPAEFDGHNEFFALTKGHAVEDCFACHTNGNFNNTPTFCFDCHQQDFENANNPDHEIAEFSNECAQCHTTDPDWKPASFTEHDGLYFPIYSGEHGGEWINCSECHENPSNYQQFTCISCHDHNQPEMDEEHDEVNGYIYNSQACFECHPTGDAENVFNHATTTFPLTGAHVETDCVECHSNGYEGTPVNCDACHMEAFNQTTNPNHVQEGIPNDCAQCHTTDPGWVPATFPIHDDYYPLTGGHAEISNDCFACHEGTYTNTPNACASCHQDDYNSSSNPNHNALGLVNECELCHTTNPDWEPAAFPVHDDYYVLQGAHVAIASDCYECHEGNYTTTPNSCFGCHADLYNQTTDPNHQTAQFPTDCETCHTQTAWEPANFNHDGMYFPIYSGEHEGEWDQCSDCHNNPTNYAIFQCLTCHPQGEMDDEHEGMSGYTYNSIACLECHPDGSSAGFDHNTTNFPLTGAHTSVDCFSCHEGSYTNTPNECAGCHIDDFNQATDPNHIESGFPQECEICHSTEPGWTPASYSGHDDIYPLTGAHSTTSCFDCHEGNYTNTPNECAGCHQDNYNQSTNPNHNTLGLTNECELCHTTNPNWQPAAFPVHNDFYPLTGAHSTIADDCFDCHEGNYNTTPNTCFGCHSDDYNQTNDPDHQTAQFPTDCELCHTNNGWEPSTFDHDNLYFPIYSGEHDDEWNQCSDCHSNPSNYSIFQCLTCHPQGEMDDEHDEVSGYQYNSLACYQCHPDGEESKSIIRTRIR
ncbi:MAG: cytochrome c3 family protein [Bacteroidales bacterium]|nr:cytochrome c3 family protein [Bacteroidales bacterium]